ncbi:terminase small subunit [Roseibium sp. RKSG952]|uniref:terminase small subunit n=1 Tax=Roseibium sp. RKSG952 TaxID=2529384 RepID=UPI0012BCEF2D|nr:terminase small subunit [Roseibium sp. RKSG952]MTH95542.1 terminase small subunit [Roseibium sp. RKSG952]
MTNAKKLNAKQQRFVEEYLRDLNATQAAIRAGYSQKTAQQMGAENLRKPLIAEAIASATKERSEEAEITVTEVLRGLKTEATLPAEKGGTHAARVAAWGHLGKYLKMFTDRHEHSGPDGGPVKVKTLNDFYGGSIKPDTEPGS